MVWGRGPGAADYPPSPVGGEAPGRQTTLPLPCRGGEATGASGYPLWYGGKDTGAAEYMNGPCGNRSSSRREDGRRWIMRGRDVIADLAGNSSDLCGKADGAVALIGAYHDSREARVSTIARYSRGAALFLDSTRRQAGIER